MIISFAWTLPALLDGRKTVTRRCWTDSYAARFRPNTHHEAWSGSPFRGGKHKADILVKTVARDPLARLISDADYAATELKLEGGLWRTVGEFVKLFKCESPYRVQFELLRIL